MIHWTQTAARWRQVFNLSLQSIKTTSTDKSTGVVRRVIFVFRKSWFMKADDKGETLMIAMDVKSRLSVSQPSRSFYLFFSFVTKPIELSVVSQLLHEGLQVST